MVVSQSWKRVLGLSSRAIILTVQRILDSYSVIRHAWFAIDTRYSGSYLNANSLTLTAVLIMTTAIMAFTLSKHWSARLHGKPHGGWRATVLAILQIAPLWEMYDKLCTHGRPVTRASSIGSLEESLLAGSNPARESKIHPPKGSPGENTMRGVRKLCIANLPQAATSLWFHAYMVLPVIPATDPLSIERDPNGILHLFLAFTAALLCMALGVADFVLYIWVDDVFVRSNKKLVTMHYLLEIFARVPLLVLFHITYTRSHQSSATWILLFGDMLITSMSLLVGHLCQRNRSDICQKQTLFQYLYYLFVSFILFFVNIVCFDPGMTVSHIKDVHFVLKTCEMAALLFFVHQTEFVHHHELPHWFLRLFAIAVIMCTFGNALIVFCIAPWRRKLVVERLISPGQASSCLGQTRETLPNHEVSSPNAQHETERRMQRLKTLEEVLELLYLLSRASCEQNRARVLDIIVSELWLLALCWDGSYHDECGHIIRIDVAPGQARSLSFYSLGKESVTAQIVANEIFVPSIVEFSHGVFDGSRICWDSGIIWERQRTSYDQLTSTRALLKLLLPQLALALKWELPYTQESLVSGSASVPKGGSLLAFLIRYATIACMEDFLLDLCWSLYCLSCVSGTYQNALRYILLYLNGNFCDSGFECSECERDFLRKAQQLLQNQWVIWKHVQFLHTDHSGRSSGGGAWTHRTQELREALRSSAYRSGRIVSDINQEMLSLGSPISSSQSDMNIDLVNAPSEAGGEHFSFPGDPNVKFLGIVIEESEVIPSKQAPLMLTCRTQVIQSTREGVLGASVRNEELPKLERYLLKFGDDLRQDQLMLQLMELIGSIWQEHLPTEEAGLLRFDLFRVLAVRPDAGCLKCVPGAVPLSEALHASQGHLENWLRSTCPGEDAWEIVMDRFCGSVAAGCVMTYVLGIGDRHLENICIASDGLFIHVDFGFVLGDDPKPIAPPVRLPQQVAQALKRTNRLSKCFDLAGQAYQAIRPFAGLLASLLRLTAEAGGAGCTKLEKNASFSIAGVCERLRIDQDDAERATAEFICLMRESSEGWSSILLDKIHAAGLFWR